VPAQLEVLGQQLLRYAAPQLQGWQQQGEVRRRAFSRQICRIVTTMTVTTVNPPRTVVMIPISYALQRLAASC
jgi:hypothetical protein